jgi:Zn finger protein HypA/HybF involved in hydrogenase expression
VTTDPDLPTVASTLRARYVCVTVWCKSCRHQAAADLQALVDAGRGDVPLTALRFRCANCRSSNTDFVVASQSAATVQPW